MKVINHNEPSDDHYVGTHNAKGHSCAPHTCHAPVLQTCGNGWGLVTLFFVETVEWCIPHCIGTSQIFIKYPNNSMLKDVGNLLALNPKTYYFWKTWYITPPPHELNMKQMGQPLTAMRSLRASSWALSSPWGSEADGVEPSSCSHHSFAWNEAITVAQHFEPMLSGIYNLMHSI